MVLTLDLVGIDRTLSERVRKGIGGDKLAMDPHNVLIATSHTHSGPVVGKNLSALHYYQLSDAFRQQIDAYAEELLANCVGCAAEAQKAATPSKLTWGSGTADFATNRRANKEAEVPSYALRGKLLGPSDHDVPVLAIRSMDDQTNCDSIRVCLPLNRLVGASVVCGLSRLCAVDAREARIMVPWLSFGLGCGADQNPVAPGTPELAEHYGKRLATPLIACC